MSPVVIQLEYKRTSLSLILFQLGVQSAADQRIPSLRSRESKETADIIITQCKLIPSTTIH